MMHAMKHPVLTSKRRNRYQTNANDHNADTHTSNEVNEGEGQRWGARAADSRCVLHMCLCCVELCVKHPTGH
jgi:hypothetical protein